MAFRPTLVVVKGRARFFNHCELLETYDVNASRTRPKHNTISAHTPIGSPAQSGVHGKSSRMAAVTASR